MTNRSRANDNVVKYGTNQQKKLAAPFALLGEV